jgi:hypothetical protein
LDVVAAGNLAKIRDRWGNSEEDHEASQRRTQVSDARFPEHERLPRRLEAKLTTVEEGDLLKMRAFIEGVRMGDDLTDNAYTGDGYRFHDIFHLACAAVLGWSPVLRANLKLKRKSDALVDEVEDGGRAAAIEEGISALVFSYAKRHASLEGISSLDYNLLKTIKGMTSHLEVAVCSLRDWERAILMAYEVWRKVSEAGGGTVVVDLGERAITATQ